MLPRTRLCLVVGVLLAVLAMTGGCGGGGGGGGSNSPSVSVGGTGGGNGSGPVGNQNCLQCHTSFPNDFFVAGDPVETRATYNDAGTGIGAAYQESVHNSPSFSPSSSNYVKCEDCHGYGGQHFGSGPIPRWAPATAQCGVCHKSPYFDLASFQGTSHYNGNNSPDTTFFQNGIGTGQASAALPPSYTEQAALFDANGDPVSKNEHIEECAVCHSVAESWRPSHIAEGNLSSPQVGCQSCHDSHSPSLRNQPTLATRTVGPDQVVRFKPQRVNNTPGTPEFGAIDQVMGTWIRPTLHFLYNVAGMTNDAGYANQLTSAGDHLRLSSERLCAACHTRGTLKHSRTAVGPQSGQVPYAQTHNQDIFTQYNNSGHADPDQLAFHEFSLLDPLSSTPGNTSGANGHRPVYPIDMGRTDGRLVDPNDATKKLGANNYTCNQCHHGIGAIDYINGVQGDLDLDGAEESQAHVLWGDSTHTCITCHDPHEDPAGTGQNLRVPKYLSYNSWFNDTNNPGAGNKRGGLNRMMDATDIPAGVGSSLICLDCHQGRESGYTIHRRMGTRGADYYTQTNGTIAGLSYSNAHYYSGGADLWSKNAFEFFFDGQPQQYSEGIPPHQALNCNGCHMAEANASNTEGGHTWKPRIETCQACHSGVTDFLEITAPDDVDGDPATATVYDSFGVVDGNATPLATDKGLFNILRYDLYTKGTWYDPNSYPYFFKVNGDGTKNSGSFTAWNVNTFVAAFNLGKVYKTGNAAYVHNYFYDAQILIDSLRTLGRTTNPSTGRTFVRPVTAGGGTTRNATDYRTLVIP